jgi:hypothetical protein
MEGEGSNEFLGEISYMSPFTDSIAVDDSTYTLLPIGHNDMKLVGSIAPNRLPS